MSIMSMKKVLDLIRAQVGQRPIWVSIDESTDVEERFVDDSYSLFYKLPINTEYDFNFVQICCKCNRRSFQQ